MSEQTVTVEAPSGLVVVLREWGVREENLAASPRLAREGKPKTRLLEAATVEVEEFGPYDPGPGKRLDWEQVAHGDREVACRDNRVNTWGDEYHRDDPCPLCSEPTDNTFLLSSFPVKLLPALSVDHIKSGKPLEVLLPREKRKATFRLFRGKDERELQKIGVLKEDERSSEVLKLRVSVVEGIDPKDLPGFLTTLNGFDSTALRGAIDDADCGLLTDAVWRCKTCGHRWTNDVDFSKDFFFPKPRRRTA